MSAQIFEFSGNGLQPLTSQGLPIGQRVRQAHKGKEGVIVDEDQVGYDVIFPDGDHAYHQRLDQLSPFTRITLLEGIAGDDEIVRLKVARDQKQAADRLAQTEAAKQHAADFEKHVEDLHRIYPWAIPRATAMSEHARAAKNLKRELQDLFPGIKFAVRSSSFAGGDSIDIRWTLGPTSKEVREIACKYQEGHFDGMNDLYENDRSAYGEAIDKVLGRAKYVSEHRDFPDDLYEKIARALCALQRIEYDGPYTRFLFGQHDRYDLNSHVMQLLSRTSFKAGESYREAEATPFEERDGGNDWCRIIKTAPTANPKKKKERNTHIHMSDSSNQLNFSRALETAVQTPGAIMEAYSAFHNYSIGNQILALIQCRTRGLQSGPIKTFKGWQAHGRFVKKGERALILCMPITFKHPSAEPAPGELDADDAFTTKFVYKPRWFVLSQTDGQEFELPTLPTWNAETALKHLNITQVPFIDTNGNSQGYARGREIAINPVAQMPHKTFFHESAHVEIGHTAEMEFNDTDDTEKTPRNLREVEAEAVALLCCEALNLDGATFCRGYIQNWLNGDSIPEASAKKIFGAAERILKAGRIEPATPETNE